MARGGPSVSKGKSRRTSSRQKSDDEDDIPEVYKEMLAEAEARAANEPETDRPRKRRRVGERPTSQTSTLKPADNETPTASKEEKEPTQTQTVYDLDLDDSDDSDMEWEEVEIQQPPSTARDSASGVEAESLQITLDRGPERRKTTVARRKRVSAAEKQLRLDIHKVHVLCLLGHVHIRNLWCNDGQVQQFLKQMLSKQTISYLNPRESMEQFARSRTFIDGLTQAMETFNRRFKVTAPGLRRPQWAENAEAARSRAEEIMRDAETILSKEDFRKQARTMQGSRDFGAQLFCALLRSVGVDARLVCSLQPLPFSTAGTESTPAKAEKTRNYIVISSDDHASSSDDHTPSRPGTPTRPKRISQPRFNTVASSSSSSPRADTPKRLQLSSYPVFWVEAFNVAVQKWIPVDPLVTKSVAKPSKFEPPASDKYNNMSYVIAFEDDASARDVTRRYVKYFNAKTRKLRVESTKNGEEWWTKTLQHFEKPFLEDRDQLEMAELTAKVAAEPMPRNIQDFKDHPIYALERHLRRNEVIHPKRVIGHVGLSKSTSKKPAITEPVYRRADVQVVRSADGWYRLGRDIKVGEQPLKRVRAVAPRSDLQDSGEDMTTEIPMYAFHQTELYQPPPVVKGKVPKNAYGNLDVYVPSMVPPGAFHLKHPEAARAARILGIDYADAVTGFEFRGRRGTAVINGIVAAIQYREALEEVIRCIENEKAQEALDRRTEEVLRLWKHFLIKLRIVEKVKGYTFEGEDAEDEREPDEGGFDSRSDDEAGGFLPEPTGEAVQPTSVGESIEDSTESGGFFRQDSTDEGGGFVSEPDDEPKSPVADTRRHVLKPLRENHQTFSRYTLVVVPQGQQQQHLDSVPPANPSSGIGSRTKYSGTQGETTGNNSSSDVVGSQESVPIVVDSSSTSVQAISRPPSAPTTRAPSQEVISSDDDSNLEQRSMLSHDPEDEDAEPEWLLSD